MSTVLNQVDEPIKAASRKTEGSTRFYTCDDQGNWSAITSGDDKSFGLRDARKMKAEGKVVVPSVTSIFSVLAKPQLDIWKQENVAKACWEQTQRWHDYKSCEEWTDAALATASQASKGAMSLGTDIHQAVEDCIAGRDYRADLQIYVVPVMAERAKREIRWSTTEKAVGSIKHAYAGRCDDHSEDTKIVRDLKSRRSKGKKVPVYETDFIQISAYGAALFGNDFFKSGKGEIWGISTSEPGAITVHEKTGPEMIEDFAAFLALNKIWQHINRFA